MNRTKIHFHKDYEELLSEVVEKIHRKSDHRFDLTNTHMRTQIKFYTPFKNSQQSQKFSQTQQLPPKKLQNHSRLINNQHIDSIKQTTYYVFGESSPTKSLQIQKIFVNLGNNRYLINKQTPINFNRTGEFYLQSMDHAETNTFNVNNLTFPVLGSNVKPRNTLLPIRHLNQSNQSKNSPPKKFKLSFSKKKGTNKSYSLEINNRTKNKNSNKNQPTHAIGNNPQSVQIKQTKFALTMSQIERRLKIQTNDYLKQVAFSNQYENKLLEMERNIVHKRRIEKLKIERMRQESTQKDKIEAWKHQGFQFNPTDELYEVFDHIKSKPLF